MPLEGARDLDRAVPVGIGLDDGTNRAISAGLCQPVHVAPERIEIDLSPGGAKGVGNLQG